MPRLVAVAALLIAACSSSSSKPDILYCAYSLGGAQSCSGYGGLNAAQRVAETQACTAESGSVVSSCPAGYVGCCTTTIAGLSTSSCYYAGDATALAGACNGAWSADDGSRGDTGRKTDGGGTGTVDGGQCAANEAICPKGCANLSSDIHNCGSCGYTCLSASCSAGVCAGGSTDGGTYTEPPTGSCTGMPDGTDCAPQNTPQLMACLAGVCKQPLGECVHSDLYFYYARAIGDSSPGDCACSGNTMTFTGGTQSCTKCVTPGTSGIVGVCF